jgi:hypothetical protein
MSRFLILPASICTNHDSLCNIFSFSSNSIIFFLKTFIQTKLKLFSELRTAVVVCFTVTRHAAHTDSITFICLHDSVERYIK